MSLLDKIKEVQNNHKKKAPAECVCEASLIKWIFRLLIPSEAEDMQFMLLEIAHTGTEGHRGAYGAPYILRDRYIWHSIRVDVQQLIRYCIHYIGTKQKIEYLDHCYTLIMRQSQRIVNF